jgi:hypothetical protein
VCCLGHQVDEQIALMMEAAHTSGLLVTIYKTTQCSISEGCYPQNETVFEGGKKKATFSTVTHR